MLVVFVAMRMIKSETKESEVAYCIVHKYSLAIYDFGTEDINLNIGIRVLKIFYSSNALTNSDF